MSGSNSQSINKHRITVCKHEVPFQEKAFTGTWEKFYEHEFCCG
jgi:hypothetical protein